MASSEISAKVSSLSNGQLLDHIVKRGPRPLTNQDIRNRAFYACPLWVKSGNTRREQMFSASPSKQTLRKRSRHACFVPEADPLRISGLSCFRTNTGEAALRGPELVFEALCSIMNG